MAHGQRLIEISDRSSIGEARRVAASASEEFGFDEKSRSNIAIVVTEAATNVVRHATTGEMLVCPGRQGETAWLDLLALDAGPGIADIARALQDGYSSHGTAGQGLGAIQRQSDEMGLYSSAGKGTALWSRFCKPGEVAPASYGAVNLPVHGEIECGDAFLVVPGARRSLYMVVDGLGHGPAAHEAAQEAVLATRQAAEEPPAEILLQAHDALKKTRGGAMSVVIADHERGVVTYAGVGNISGMLGRNGLTRSLVSQNGTVGAVMPRHIQEYTQPFEPGGLLLMFSDGISSKCSLSGYPGLAMRHPQLIAGVLYRDFARKRDDATVLVARLEGARA